MSLDNRACLTAYENGTEVCGRRSHYGGGKMEQLRKSCETPKCIVL